MDDGYIDEGTFTLTAQDSECGIEVRPASIESLYGSATAQSTDLGIK